MRTARYIPLFLLLTGCSSETGQVDFVSPPLFELPLGNYRALMFFSDSTVLRMGGTYYIVSVPFWVLVAFAAGCIALIIYRMRRHEKHVA